MIYSHIIFLFYKIVKAYFEFSDSFVLESTTDIFLSILHLL